MIKRGINPDFVKMAVNLDANGADADFPNGFLEGYASVFNNVDLGGDVVKPGAFTKTLKERLKNGDIKLVDSHNIYEGTGAVVGVVKQAGEDAHGLKFKASFSAVSRAQDIRTKIKEGILGAISFGYDIVKAKPSGDVLELQELKLWEVSPVIWGMNPEAQSTAVKSAFVLQSFTIQPDVSAPMDFPDAAAKSWVGGEIEEWTVDEWKKYAKMFLWHDASKWMEMDSYKFPVVSIVDGEPKYNFRGAVAALKAVRSTQGPWSGDASKLEVVVKGIYEKFNQPFPDSGDPIDPVVQLVSFAADIERKLRMNRLMNTMSAFTNSQPSH